MATPVVSGRNTRKTTAEFVEQAAEHWPTYDFSEVAYVDAHTKVRVGCPLHGVFFQTPCGLLTKYGCPQCGRERKCKSLSSTQQEFLRKARAVHGNRYGYDSVQYVDCHTPVIIHCTKHGEFRQKPLTHLTGRKCRACGIEERNASLFGSLEDFRQRATETHQGRYTYEESVYRGAHAPLTIHCTVCGTSFRQTPAKHLKGQGCKSCSLRQAGERGRNTQEHVLKQFHASHGNRYDYSQMEYTGSKSKVAIGCPKHGIFWQYPFDHISGHGCPSCVHLYSTPHKEIEALLTEWAVPFQSNVRSVIAPCELDVFVGSQRVAIEFNGTYWHSIGSGDDLSDRNRHLRKFARCSEKNITLLQIDQHEWDNPTIRDVWCSVLKSKLGLLPRLHARQTHFAEISRKDASQFLAENHIQGSSPALRWNFGLHHEGALVSVMSFASHQRHSLNLTRLATRRGVTVVGGARKLFHHALENLPRKPIVTFSNNRYSDGHIYPVLGFVHDGKLPASYQWWYKGRVLNKRLCRHSKLLVLLGTLYDPELTEHENMFRAGARCLYDAGYQRWVCPR